jgi:primosomal protein DnaI
MSSGEKPSKHIDKTKKVSVLILDDIGAENVMPWIRDEVLSPILQYRMTHKSPTLFTSNFNFDLLEEHLAYSEKGASKMKARRLMERIRHNTKEILIDDVDNRQKL